MRSGSRPPEDWRAYQTGLQQKERKKEISRRVPLLALYAGGLAFLVLLITYGVNSILVHFSEASYPQAAKVKQPVPKPVAIDTEGLWPLISPRFGEEGNTPNLFPIRRNDIELTVQTTIVPKLQKYIYHLLERSQAEKAAVVVLRPRDGRVLAMVSYRKDGETGDNLCLASRFPAASLFKIVSAAAAIEKAHFTPDRMITFVGRAHTLYRNQLTKKVNRYSTTVTFRKAFATSINPVFGKLGIYILGRRTVVDYAQKFFFNRAILFDLPLSPSVIDVPEDPYGIAEVTSGFNRRTLISPFHAALLACAVANGGKVMKPWVINEIRGEARSVYQAHPDVLGIPIAAKTAQYLQAMMHDTVRYGTCRKSFWHLQRKRRFRGLNLGAKTGTINDSSDLHKYDWITAYAMPKDNSDGICLAVLEVHGRKLGVRSREIARAIINYEILS
jgi:peptidoglycan glycosyltransferase